MIEKARVRRCVGNPPRQTEDPQSPPCVAYWDDKNGNGGATFRGVSASEIKVTVYEYRDSASGPDLLPLFERYFNDRFEFYGRKLKLSLFNAAPTGASVAQMQADAQAIAKQKQSFAHLNYSEQEGAQSIFYDQLSRYGVVNVQGSYSGISTVDEAHLARFAPYQWNVLPTVDKVLANTGEMWCKQLNGKAPAYAGAAERQRYPVRKLGVLRLSRTDQPAVDLKPLDSALAACGAHYLSRDYQDTRDVAPALLDFRQQEVTSILCLCPSGHFALLWTPQASSSNYRPEWLVTNYIHLDDDGTLQATPRDHYPGILGLQSWNKFLPLEDTPWWWAVKEADPSFNNRPSMNLSVTYNNLLVLASGIQAAGPNLTPETFAAGLRSTRFPNPGAGAAPYFQATVGFENDHTFQNDFAPVWASPTDPSFFFPGRPGTYCNVLRGVRYSAGRWPTTPLPFRELPCR